MINCCESEKQNSMLEQSQYNLVNQSALLEKNAFEYTRKLRKQLALKNS